MDYPTVFSTADIIVHDNQGRFIVGRKAKDGAKWRFPGGFVDPELDSCYLDAAVREAGEELLFDFSEYKDEFVYLGDYEINDSRYVDTPHTVFTNLYAVKMDSLDLFAAGDDLDEISIMDLLSVAGDWAQEEHIIREHQEILEVFIDYFKNTYSSYGDE